MTEEAIAREGASENPTLAAEACKAFIEAQAEMKNALMKKTNPHFKSKYADLTAVREATLPALKKHGLGIIQVPTLRGDGSFVLYSRLIHTSGVVLQECVYPLNVDGKPQQIGSEITYARRYTWASLCGISSDEDDDANIAQEAPKKSDLQKTADKIAKELRAAKDTVDTDDVWLKHGDDLDKIKSKSAKAFDALQDIYKHQLEGFKQAEDIRDNPIGAG